MTITTAAQPLDLDKPLTGEDLMRLVFQRPDVSPAGREAEISYVMRGRGELTMSGGDFDTMAEHVNAMIAQARAAQPESAIAQPIGQLSTAIGQPVVATYQPQGAT